MDFAKDLAVVLELDGNVTLVVNANFSAVRKGWP
jgi:hypothetical protein